MQEGDAFAFGAYPGNLVDERDAGAPAAVEGGGEVVDSEADVVDAGPSFGDEPGDRRVRGFRFQKLHEGITGTQAGDAGAVRVVQGFLGKSENVAIEGKDAIERVDRDADVSDPSTTRSGFGHMRCSYMVGALRIYWRIGEGKMEDREMLHPPSSIFLPESGEAGNE